MTLTQRDSLKYYCRWEEMPVMTVNDVSKLSGVSIRALQYYDSIGLLKPSGYSKSGYRLYDDTALERLQQILLFRELEFPLKAIKKILDAPDFDRTKALEQQIELLRLKKDHLEELIAFAEKLKQTGGKQVDFKAFDKKKIDEYSRRAKEQWGNTPEYREFEEKTKGSTVGEQQKKAAGLMRIFAEFGEMRTLDPADEKAQLLVKRLQEHISENYYDCSNEILGSLGKMYAAGGEFTENIDDAGGKGTAVFAAKAIEIYCGK